jgi:hypothetical protein
VQWLDTVEQMAEEPRQRDRAEQAEADSHGGESTACQLAVTMAALNCSGSWPGSLRFFDTVANPAMSSNTRFWAKKSR